MANVDQMFEGVRDALTVKRVYGEPYEQNGLTVIPAAAVRGGAGGGGDSDHNGGGGFGIHARPVGAWVIRGDEVNWRPAVDRNRMTRGWQLVAGFALLGAWSIGRRRARG